MKPITQIMIKEFKIDKLGYDFMGYTFKRKEDLSFHHLVVAHRDCKKMGLGEGYTFDNGAILTQNPKGSDSHDYLHIIERVDPEIFYLITSEMIDENILRRIEIENLKRIRTLLEYFEKEHCADYTKKGRPLIKEEYITQRIKL